ncbi:translation initiation factor IF-2 [Ixodes scapularis]
MAGQTKKGRTLGPRVSARQFEILWDYLSANPALVRAATDSPLTQDERKVLWDVAVSDLNAQGPAVKTRAEWKGYWNSRVYAARGRDRDATTSARQTGGGANQVPPLNAEEEKILALVGTDSSRGCGGRRVGCDAPTPLPAPSDDTSAAAAAPSPAVPDAGPDSPPASARVASPPPPCDTLPPRNVRPRSGTECTARDLLAAQQEQLAVQKELLATQQGLLRAQERQLAIQERLLASHDEMLVLQRGAAEALRGLTSAVQALAASSAQQASSLTTLVLHLMGVRNLQPQQ